MADNDSNGYLIPRWFIWVSSILMSLFMMAFAPWAVWVTGTLIRIEVKSEQNQELRILVLETRKDLNEHITDPTLHSSAHAVFRARLDDVERRLDRIEGKRQTMP